MTANQATGLVLRILGIADCPVERRNELRSFMELLITGQPTKQTEKPRIREEVNDLKPEENTISLADSFHFDFPKEFNLQVEGQEGTRKIKIFPDGLSESQPAAQTEA